MSFIFNVFAGVIIMLLLISFDNSLKLFVNPFWGLCFSWLWLSFSCWQFSTSVLTSGLLFSVFFNLGGLFSYSPLMITLISFHSPSGSYQRDSRLQSNCWWSPWKRLCMFKISIVKTDLHCSSASVWLGRYTWAFQDSHYIQLCHSTLQFKQHLSSASKIRRSRHFKWI